jgi:hypothetical protein
MQELHFDSFLSSEIPESLEKKYGTYSGEMRPIIMPVVHQA